MTYRSKPKIVEAEQFWPDRPLPFHKRGPYVQFNNGLWFVTTAQGMHAGVRPGDYIVIEGQGPHTPSFSAYPVRADIFENSYELVDPPPPASADLK